MSVGWGLIGTGRVAAQMADAIGRAEGTHAASVLSRDSARGAAFAANHGVATVAGSLEELLVNDAVDVVYVASPNGLHVAQTLAAADAGKHVLCEKPMATSLGDCDLMDRRCRERGVQLGIAFQYRQHPAHIAMRQAVRDGLIGRPVLADAAVCLPAMSTPDWYGDPALAGGGVIPMSGVHRLDLISFILEASPVRVCAMLSTRDADRPYEDTAAAVVAFEGGATATVRFAMDVPYGGDPIAIHGTEGSLEARGTTSQWWGGGGGEVTLRVRGSTHKTSYDSVDLYQLQVESFVAQIGGRSTSVGTARDGAAAVVLTAAIVDASNSGTTVTVGPGLPRH